MRQKIAFVLLLFVTSSAFQSRVFTQPSRYAHHLTIQSNPSPEDFLEKRPTPSAGSSSTSNTATIAATLVQQNKQFLDWLSTEGNLHLQPISTWFEAPHPVAISLDTRNVDTNESSGRGIVARVDIPSGGEILRVPMKVCITKSTAVSTFGPGVIPPSMNEYIALALILIREKFALPPGTSYFSAYVDVLPPTVESVSPTFTWGEQALETLKGSPLLPATISLQNKLKAEYESFVLPLVESKPDVFSEDVYNMENWLWAFTMLFSRAVRLTDNLSQDGGAREKIAMVPYADLINHSPFSRSFIASRLTPGKIMWEKTDPGLDEEVIIYADRPVRKMEQIYVNYGEKSSSDFMLFYGFGGGESNPFNSVDVTIGILPPKEGGDEQTLALFDKKIAFLKQMDAPLVADFPVYSDRYPTEMLEYCRLMLLTTEECEKKENLDEFDFTKPVGRDNEARVLMSVIRACKAQLDKYPSTEEQDAAIIGDKGMFGLLGMQERMGIRQRRSEKRLLKRTVAALEREGAARGLFDPDADDESVGVLYDEYYNQNSVVSVDGKTRRKSSLEKRLSDMGLPVDLR